MGKAANMARQVASGCWRRGPRRARARRREVSLAAGTRPRRLWAWVCLPCLVVLALAAPAAWGEASAGGWGQPTNLSQSGSASQPVVIGARGGAALQAFWWDQFDGLMTARFGETWSPAQAAPILVWDTGRQEAVPLAKMPQIVADGVGGAHAFWLPTDTGQGLTADVLYHAAYSSRGQTWSALQQVADGVIGWAAFPDAAGTLHVAYVRQTQTALMPAGVYHTALRAGATDWPAPRVVSASIYARLMTASQVRLAGAADEAGNVNLAWYDPREARMLIARSPDGGQSWQEARAVPVPEAAFPLLAAPARGEVLALWRASVGGMGLALYQQSSHDGGSTWDPPQRVLPDLAAPGQETALVEVSQGRLLLVAGLGTYALTVSEWTAAGAEPGAGAGWSEPLSVALAVQGSEASGVASLEVLRLWANADYLAVVGQGQDGEVWALRRPYGDVAWQRGEAASWSTPAGASQAGARSSAPAVAAGRDGRLYAVWAEALDESGTTIMYASGDDSGWEQAVQALHVEAQEVEDLSIAVGAEWLYVVWGEPETGAIYTVRASLPRESGAAMWGEAVRLPVPVGAEGAAVSPHLVVDLRGRLHAVYAVPLDEDRGVYYVWSDSQGLTWSEPSRVFDAVVAGWRRVGETSLAVDTDGTVYVAWARLALLTGVPEALCLAESHDGGIDWSGAYAMAEGPVGTPLLGVSQQGQVHLLWHDTARDVWMARTSPDAALNWSDPAEVPGSAAAEGAASLTYDLAGHLYLLAVTRDAVGEPMLRYSSWSSEGGQWGAASDFRLSSVGGGQVSVAAALAAESGQLHALVSCVEGTGEQSARWTWHTHRAVAPVEVIAPAPSTPTPLPRATRTPTPATPAQPTPVIDPRAPHAGGRSVGLGPLSLPLTAVIGLALVALSVVGVAVMRETRAR